MGLGLGWGVPGIVANVVLPILARIEEDKALQEKNEQDLIRYNQGLANIRDARERTLPMIRSAGQRMIAEMTKAYGIGKDKAAEIVKGFEDRVGSVEGLLDKLGNAERADIERSFSAMRGQGQADLTRRGLANTFMRNANTALAARGRSEALTRLNESVSNVKAGFRSQLTGDVLAAKQAEAQFLTGGADSIARAGYDVSNRASTVDLALTEAENQWIYNREDEYVPTSVLRELQGNYASAAQAREQEKLAKEAQGNNAGGIGAGVGAALSIVAAPFTAGASLAYLPAATAAGGAIGGAFQTGPSAAPVSYGGGLPTSQSIQAAQNAYGRLGLPSWGGATYGRAPSGYH